MASASDGIEGVWRRLLAIEPIFLALHERAEKKFLHVFGFIVSPYFYCLVVFNDFTAALDIIFPLFVL